MSCGNRSEACRQAKIEPIKEALDEGVDPVAYILSVNVTRRHLSKGQAAMAVARACLLQQSAVRWDRQPVDRFGLAPYPLQHACLTFCRFAVTHVRVTARRKR
jgi:hypothetical protein